MIMVFSSSRVCNACVLCDFLQLLASINTVVSIFESLIYDGRIKRQDLNQSPIFILGHPRTGTT